MEDNITTTVKSSSEKEAHATKKPKKNKKWTFAVFLVLSISVLVCLLLIISGRMDVKFKSPGQTVSLTGNVCTKEVVDKFNLIMEKQFDIGEKTDYSENIKKLLETVNNKPGFESDPTCQFIAFRRNVFYESNFFEAAKNLDKIKKLNREKTFVDNSIVNLSSIPQMEFSLSFYKDNPGLAGVDENN